MNLLFEKFEHVGDANSGQKWVKYVNDYENFCAFQDITDDKRKMCGLLHCAGSDVQDIYETLKANPDVETTDSSTQVVKKEAAPVDKYADVCRKLNAHFNPKKNVIYEIHVFRNLRQLDGENTLQFATRLREAARFCEFTTVEREIVVQILQNGSSEWLTQKVLEQEKEPTLEALLKMASARELSTAQSKEMRSTKEMVYSISKSHHKQQSNQQTSRNRQQQYQQSNQSSETKCNNCGRNESHLMCPAKDKDCNSCGKRGHFAGVCRSKNRESNTQGRGGYNDKQRVSRKHHGKVNFVSNDEDMAYESKQQQSFKEFTFAISQRDQVAPRTPRTRVNLRGRQVDFVVDTGSSLNIIDIEEYNKLDERPALNAPICNAYGFNSKKPINFLGRFKTRLEKNGHHTDTEVHVLKYVSSSPNLMSYATASALGLIKIVSSIELDSLKASMKERYPQLFCGEIGCLKNFELKLYEDESVKPCKRYHYKIPYHLQTQVAAHLDKHERDGLIERATGPTSWISASHVVPKKDGRIRLVIDGRPVNKAIIRHRH